ncbi:DUF3396 domain-containing protein [Myxococcus sp. AM011]|nr:DUF3396 domain-containing protein [Myxococcus sp. AM011]
MMSEGGDVVVRDGLVLCFYMRHSHRDVADRVWGALEKYRRAIPPHALGWYGSDDGDTLPLDEAGWAHIRHQIVERPWGGEWIVELTELPDKVGGYHVDYDGRKLDEPLFSRDDSATSGLCFSFPTEYLLTHGPEHFRALALDIARELPFSFGYASPALLSHPGVWFCVRQQVQEVLQRYLGLDLPRLGGTSRRMGTQARGAYWLTFMGPPLLAQLGGREAVERQVDLPGVRVEPLDEERILVALDEWPEALDMEKQPVPLPYRELERVLEPFLYDEEAVWLPWETGTLQRWGRRLRR